MSDIELKPCPKCGSTSVKYFEYDDGYSVFCRRCQFELYPHKLEKFAAEEWNDMPRPLQWTIKTPTEAGWYWCALGDQEHIAIVFFKDGSFQVAGESETYTPVEGRDDILWAGPIPKPLEEKK